MLERALEAYTPEKDNEVPELLMTVLENRQAVFSRAARRIVDCSAYT